MLGTVGGVARQQVGDRHGDEAHRSSGWRGRAFFSRPRKPLHVARSFSRSLSCVVEATCGIDQHGLVGEPPVTVACASDTAHGVLADLVGEQGKLRPLFCSAVVLPEPGAPMIRYQGRS